MSCVHIKIKGGKKGEKKKKKRRGKGNSEFEGKRKASRKVSMKAQETKFKLYLFTWEVKTTERIWTQDLGRKGTFRRDTATAEKKKKFLEIHIIWEDPYVTILLFRQHAIGCLWNKSFKRSYWRNKTLNCPKEFVRTRQYSLEIPGRIHKWHGVMRYKTVIHSPL